MARFVKKIFPKPYIDEFTEEEIYGMFFREKCNCFGIWDQKDRCLASAIFPSASFFNHSCVPNCTRFPDHAGLIAIRALYPIPAGTELNISYITLHDSPRETRMEQLRYYYCFECGCPRCSDPTGETDKFIERFLCKRDGCTGLLVPLETDKVRIRRSPSSNFSATPHLLCSPILAAAAAFAPTRSPATTPTFAASSKLPIRLPS
jgi:hypothetical protein